MATQTAKGTGLIGKGLKNAEYTVPSVAGKIISLCSCVLYNCVLNRFQEGAWLMWLIVLVWEECASEFFLTKLFLRNTVFPETGITEHWEWNLKGEDKGYPS